MTAQMEQDTFALTPDPSWLLSVEDWQPRQEASVEAVLALVNGYQGTRAAVEEGSSASTPAMFLNGVFDAAHEAVAQAGATPDFQVIAAPTPELVVAPNWSRLRISVDGRPLDLETGTLLDQRRTLDLRRGVLVREWRVRSGERTVRLRSLRFASLDNRHVLGQILELTPEDGLAQVSLDAIIDAAVTNEGGVQHLVETHTRPTDGGRLLQTETSEKHIRICFASSAALSDGTGQPVSGEDVSTDTAVVERWTVEAAQGQTLTLQKIVAVFTSRDDADPAARAEALLQEAVERGVSALVQDSAQAWAERWSTADVQIGGNAETQRQVRFALYHLIGCANPEDEYASPGARSLTGERYKGHVFWDTEIFVFPFFVYTHPATARALLMYRYHTLPAAKAKAEKYGYRGALYAWESTDTGDDVTPPFVYNSAGERLEILTGIQEHHISADVAFATWQYWHATEDEAFFLSAGAEMLLELARFWASRAEQGDDGKYHIRAVIGPDEFHEHCDDNAYTNAMAQWVLRRGLEVVDLLQSHHPERWQELSQKIDYSEAEPGRWVDVADGLVINFDPATKLFEQHRGYFDLEYIDLAAFEPRTKTMDVLLGWSRLTKTQIIKQADVVMLLFLLGDRFPREVHEANFRFYEPRTSNDSSLSPSFQALAAARLGDLKLAEQYFTKAANLDLDFSWGVTAAGGVHIAALGGMWQALVFGFGGTFVTQAGLQFRPHVPADWETLRFALQWRGRRLNVTAQGETAQVEQE